MEIAPIAKTEEGECQKYCLELNFYSYNANKNFLISPFSKSSPIT